ncbi:LLM class F420-dependent oxidoreductase [Nocardia otitidiscaviarum]|uniref:LLM class F420-dependent oxidoreductase n=1 Tax=Nocardia otitidiscaviarum TaxID=1823 RepID=A0A516NKT9_9NOCA|nr:LLM class F420-dependent oxidoreductase [Nocardia otitidiscaviarum]MCP9618847.1 LLM class F420-dependent oxidoreductase [Nocardia otitidiscaviarum]QDP79528.1 LLM class F420-dependent oxidoreductase [Nocardia otitidiscaviarum]
MEKPFRFGVNLTTPGSRSEWVTKCQRAEALGYDVISVPDHLGLPAPFPALAVAAEVTERVRLNTFVLNTPFYNPVLLARDVAGLDALSRGRFELGLGAGYVQAEFDAAALPFPTAGQRVDQLERTVTTLRDLLADPEYQPRPAQAGGPPLLIAGWGDRVLALAARHARIIGFAGASPSTSGHHLTLADPAAFTRKLEHVRGLLGPRLPEVELNLLVQQVATPADRDALAAGVQPHMPPGDTTVEELPTLLIGTPEQIADTLRERRERYGFSYITVLEPSMEKLAPVIELLR